MSYIVEEAQDQKVSIKIILKNTYLARCCSCQHALVSHREELELVLLGNSQKKLSIHSIANLAMNWRETDVILANFCLEIHAESKF